MSKRMVSVVAGAVILFNAAVFAQVSVQPGIAVGLTSFSENLKAPGITITPDSKTGFTAGAVLDISVMSIVSVEPGLFFTGRGMTSSNTDALTGTTYTATENLSYLTIPVHAKLKYPLPMVKPYGLAGLNLGILLSAKDKVEETGQPTVEESVKDSLNSTDLGFDVGAGVEFALPAVTPFVEFVYYMGFLNMMKNAPAEVTLKQNGWDIKAGLRFAL